MSLRNAAADLLAALAVTTTPELTPDRRHEVIGNARDALNATPEQRLADALDEIDALVAAGMDRERLWSALTVAANRCRRA